MMVQDSLTGYVHEVPDIAEAPVYDGFGNPIGFLGRRRGRRSAPAAPPPEGSALPEAGSGMEEEPGEVGETVYDGFGNPIGFNPFKAIGSAIRSVGSVVASPFRTIGNLVSRAPGAIAALPAAGLLLPSLLSQLMGYRRSIAQYQSSGQPVPPQLMQNYNNLLAQYRRSSAQRRPWPRGWRRPPLPYTGLGPRRLYMRCAVWPGPKGLVPGYATTAQGVQMQQAAMRAGMMGRRRRRRRR